MTTARTITNAWIHRTLPDIFYEEPEPVEDGMQQEFSIQTIKGCLWERYLGRSDIFVSNAIFISYDRTNGNARIQPDLFIAFGVDAAAIRENLPNFWIWETGKVPDFVMEVASPSTAANDTGPKRNLYQRLGVTEYWRFDPTGGELYGQPLQGERLIGGRYTPCEITAAPDGSQRSRSQLLNLDFSWNGAEFDVLDPTTGKSIKITEIITAEQEARTAEQEARHAAEDQAAQSEAAYIAAQSQAAQAEAARHAAQSQAAQAEAARHAAEAQAAQAEAARQAAEAQASQSEAARQAAEAQASQAEAARQAAEAEIARLRQQLRRYEPG